MPDLIPDEYGIFDRHPGGNQTPRGKYRHLRTLITGFLSKIPHMYRDFRRNDAVVSFVVGKKDCTIVDKYSLMIPEVSKARNERNPEIIEPTREVTEALARNGASGVLNVQRILNSDEKAYFIEINPRSGLGFSIKYLTVASNQDIL